MSVSLTNNAVSAVVQQPQYGIIVVQPADALASSASSVPTSVVGTPPEKSVFVFSQNGGRDGDDGADATVHARRYEESGNYIYAATAPAGSAEGSSVWRITRITYSSGTQTATGVATAVTWTGRAGHAYV